jgi:hypothetical protein
MFKLFLLPKRAQRAVLTDFISAAMIPFSSRLLYTLNYICLHSDKEMVERDNFMH